MAQACDGVLTRWVLVKTFMGLSKRREHERLGAMDRRRRHQVKDD